MAEPVDLYPIYEKLSKNRMRQDRLARKDEETQTRTREMVAAARNILERIDDEPRAKLLRLVDTYEAAESAFINCWDVAPGTHRYADDLRRAIRSKSYCVNWSPFELQNPCYGFFYCLSSPDRIDDRKIGFTARSVHARIQDLKSRFRYRLDPEFAIAVSWPKRVESDVKAILLAEGRRISGRTKAESVEWYRADTQAIAVAAIEALTVEEAGLSVTVYGHARKSTMIVGLFKRAGIEVEKVAA